MTPMTSFRAAAASAAFLLAAILASCLPSCAADERGNKQKSVAAERAGARSDNYWKKKLDPEAYQITRCGGTEAPFSGKYWNNHETGVYRCSNCGALLFDSTDKYDSGTGWPSFSKAHQSAVLERKDRSHGMVREEVICKHCGAHLGHLFDDGPAPTGQRFCINSASLNFDKAKQAK